MKTTTFNVCTWILLASLVLSVSARAKSAHKCAEAVDSNSGNGVPGQHRMSKAGSIAENWEVARGLRDGTPNSYVRQLYSRVEGSKIIRDINSKTKLKTSFDEFQIARPLTPANSADKLKNLNEGVFSKQRNIYEKRKFKGAAGLTNIKFARGRKKKSVLKETVPEPDYIPLQRSNGTMLDPHDIDKGIKNFYYFNDTVIVYSDGSACKHNSSHNKPTAGAGVWFGHNHPLNLMVQVPGPQTNNNAELFAAALAIERVKITGLKRVSVNIDSYYLRKVLIDWMPKWTQNGFKTSLGRKVKNKRSIERLQTASDAMEYVYWNYTRYNDGIVGNREAEKLSRVVANCV